MNRRRHWRSDQGERVAITVIDVNGRVTKAPARYTPRPPSCPRWRGAGKLVDDEELREAMRNERGWGPATRAAIIEA